MQGGSSAGPIGAADTSFCAFLGRGGGGGGVPLFYAWLIETTDLACFYRHFVPWYILVFLTRGTFFGLFRGRGLEFS